MIGFLLWNRPPARIYMGDAGALFLGILIATLTIRLHPETHTKWVSFSTPILLLAVPILDTSVAVISRLSRGVSPFQGGRDHLSHRLMRAGMERPLAAVTLWVFSAFFAFIAVLVSSLDAIMEQRVVGLAAIVWVGLFAFFIRTQDA
jgi:UDP-GlcNAc:undecaprenyl-phosphate GlcNAc-1-phosphate transferase